MFIANAGAITSFLIKLDINTFKLPIFIFSIGVAYALFIPILMYFLTDISNYDPPKIDILKKFYDFIYLTAKKCKKYVVIFIIYMPMIFFIFGIMTTLKIVNK